LFVDILTTGAPVLEDRRYDLKLLERRLRTTVREHEYAAPLGDQGFVVAARGAFNPGELDALATRIAERLSMPLRGHGGTRSPQLCVGGTRSLPGEPDVQLILRAELARAKALAAGPGTIHLD
jgi:GGDEF domain-containing protein